MTSNEIDEAVTSPAPGLELYLPIGATDPDFYIPAEWQREERGLRQWMRKFLR